MEVFDPDVAAGLYILACETLSAIGFVKFLDALACGPLRLETGHQSVDLVEIDAVAALVRASPGSVFDAGSPVQERKLCLKTESEAASELDGSGAL